MTVSSETARWDYVGNGSNDTFPYTAEIYDETDLKVYVDDIIQTINVAYTIPYASVNNPAGGNVIFEATYIPSADADVVILLDLPITQETDYVEGDKFPAETHETALDRLTKICQALRQAIDHAVRFASYAATDLVMPDPSPGEYIGWNADGSNLENKSGPIVYDATPWEIDALVTYGGGTAYTKATIDAALTAIGTSTKATLLLRPGNWTITASSDYSSYANVLWRLPNGAYFTISSGQTLTIPSPDHLMVLPTQQIFSGAGAASFAGTGTVYPEWWGINGTSDETEINLAFASLAAGGTVDCAAASYTIDGYITPANNTTMIIRPWTTITLAAASNCQMLVFVTKSNIRVEGGGILDGNKANQTGGASTHVVYLSTTCSDISFDNITSKNGYLDNFYISTGENISIRGCKILGSNQDGIDVVGSSHIKILNNYMSGNVVTGGTANILLYGSSINDDILIDGNTIVDSGELVGSAHGVYVYHSAGVVISNNYINNMFGFAVEVNEQTEGVESVIIDGNTMIECGDIGSSFGSIWIGAAAPTIVTNNVIHKSELHGIHMDGSNRCVITGNIITDCKNNGTCIVGDPTYSIISNNTVGGLGIATPLAGISISTDTNTVVGNILYGSTYDYINTKENGLDAGLNVETLADWRVGNTLDGLSGQTKTLAGAYTVYPGYSGVYFLDPGGAHRNIVCSSGFKQGSVILIVNKADAAENLVFDSAGIAETVGQNESGIFAFDGTIWSKIFSGMLDTNLRVSSGYAQVKQGDYADDWEDIERTHEISKAIILVEDFLGTASAFDAFQIGWACTQAGAGALVSIAGPVDGVHYGAASLQTGTTNAGVAAIRLPYITSTIIPGGDLKVEFIVMTPGTLSDVAETYKITVGLLSVYDGTAPNDGIYFTYAYTESGGSWECITCKDAAETTTDSGIDIITSTWYRLGFISSADGATIRFYIDGVLVATHTTNIPVGSDTCGPVAVILKSVGITDRLFLVDAFYLRKRTSR
jgi:parallel beta-helix repeat protein